MAVPREKRGIWYLGFDFDFAFGCPEGQLVPPLPACGERSDSERSEAERRNPGEGAFQRF